MIISGLDSSYHPLLKIFQLSLLSYNSHLIQMNLAFKRIYKFSYALRSPINPDLLKSPEGKMEIQKRLAARFKPATLYNEVIESYEHFRKDLYDFEKLSQQSNQIKKKLKETIKAGSQVETQALKKELVLIKQQLAIHQNKVKASKTNTESYLQKIGNAVYSQTVKSKDQQDNKVLRYFHPDLQLPSDISSIQDHQMFVREHFTSQKPIKNYQELTQEFGIADLTRGQKVSGHRGYFLCGNGVKLALALAQYGLDFLEKRGFSLYQTPALILQSVLRDSCQLQSIQSDMYRFREDDLCLIATSEQTLAGYYKGETFQPKQLPKMMAGYSSCFRREAGAHGKDIHGLFRLHQFEKVQQFLICQPEESEKYMLKMVDNAQAFYQSLKIPYRVVDIVSGELNDSAYRKIDLEAWFPGQQRFRQLVSVSNCLDYQSRLLQTKFREGKSVKYPHMLNGTLVAIQRTITCLLQHFYNEPKGALSIPEALQPYIRTSTLKRE